MGAMGPLIVEVEVSAVEKTGHQIIWNRKIKNSTAKMISETGIMFKERRFGMAVEV